MQFNQLAGHHELISRLKQSAREGRVAHAQLFAGTEGSGALPLALAYANFLLCENPADDSCGHCPACKKIAKREHPDVHFAFPVVKTDKTGTNAVSKELISEWREFVNSRPYGAELDWYDQLGVDNKQGNISVHESAEILKALSLKSYEGGYKIMLIWLPEKMNTAAANKLLKILEEPPQMTVFLLVSHQAESLLTTIQSRLQWIYVPRLDDENVTKYLMEELGVDPENARLVASLAEGNLNRAIQIIQNNEGISTGTALFVEWARACYRPDYPKLIKWTEEVSRLGREHQKDFLRLAISMMRDALLHHYGLGALERMGITQQTFDLAKFAPFIHSGNIENIIEELSRSHYEIERNANAKIVFLDTSLQLHRLLRVPEPA